MMTSTLGWGLIYAILLMVDWVCRVRTLIMLYFLRIHKRNKTMSNDEIIPAAHCVSLYDISPRQK